MPFDPLAYARAVADVRAQPKKPAPPERPRSTQLDGLKRAKTPLDLALGARCFDYSGFDVTPLLKKPEGSLQLFPIQSEGLLAVRHAQGTLWATGVGSGKTWKALLAAEIMRLGPDELPTVREMEWTGSEWAEVGLHPMPECEPVDLVVYMTKKNLVSQVRGQVSDLRRHFDMRAHVDVRSYWELSQGTDEDVFPVWVGDTPERVLVVFDECHKLKSPTSSRRARVQRAFKKCPGVRYAVASGTIFSTKLQDVAHLAKWALGDNTPFPQHRSLHALGDWVNHRGECYPRNWEVPAKYIAAFGWTEDKAELDGGWADQAAKQRAVRRAFANRLKSAPGVVVSQSLSVDCRHTIYRINDLPLPEELTEIRRVASTDLLRPDGESLEIDEMAKSRFMRQTSCGFWYRWVWGEDGPDYDWMDARSEWQRQLRVERKDNADEGYDSEMLITRAVKERIEARGHARGDLERAWVEWEEQRALRPQPPPKEEIWESDFLIQDVVARAEALGDCVIWYRSGAVARALQAAGVEVLFAGDPLPDEVRTIAASIDSHGTGLNGLQKWETQIIVETPSGGETWEQLLGRLLRTGQDAEHVRTYVYTHTREFQNAWHGAVQNANMLQTLTMNRQRLCMATHALAAA